MTHDGSRAALLEDRGAGPRAIAVASVGVEHAGARQRLGPRQAAGHVVFEQAAIERERHAEIKRRRIGRGVKPSGP